MAHIKLFEEFTGNDNWLSKVDYTELSQNVPEEHIQEVCEKAIKLGVASVCLRPEYVSIASEVLQGSDVKVCTVISFPEGTNSIQSKKQECKKAIIDGAEEIDMVINWRKLKEIYEEGGVKYDSISLEVSELARICHQNDCILKVIVESSELSLEETKIATKICLTSNADFIKTSTGFAPNGIGAELDKIKMMYNTIKEFGVHMRIKASGGIRDIDAVKKFEPYVDRFGIGYKSVDTISIGEKSTSSY